MICCFKWASAVEHQKNERLLLVGVFVCVHWTVWKVFCNIYYIHICSFSPIANVLKVFLPSCTLSNETFDWLQCKYFVHLVWTELFRMKTFFMRGIVVHAHLFLSELLLPCHLVRLLKYKLYIPKENDEKMRKEQAREHNTGKWKRPLERKSWNVYINNNGWIRAISSRLLLTYKKTVIRDEAHIDNGGIVAQHNTAQHNATIPFQSTFERVWTGFPFFALTHMQNRRIIDRYVIQTMIVLTIFVDDDFPKNAMVHS